MEEKNKKTNEITFVDVVVFFVRNRKILLISFLISLATAGGYYVYTANQTEIETVLPVVIKEPVIAEMVFRYHEPWYEIRHQMKRPANKLVLLSRDISFITKVIDRTYMNLSLSESKERISKLAETIIMDEKISLSYKYSYSEMKNEADALIKFEECELPDSVNFKDFSREFLKSFYSISLNILDMQLKDRALRGIDKEYIFYKQLDDDIRDLEVDSIRNRITLYRRYVNDVVQALGSRGPVTYIGGSVTSSGTVEQHGSIISIFIVMIFAISLIPLLFKYFILGIRNLFTNTILKNAISEALGKKEE